MTIQSSLSKALYYGDGNSVNFAFNFKVFNAGQITVTVADSEGNYDVVDADSISLNSDGTGTVVYTLDGSPLPEGYALAITRDMDFLQEKSFSNAAKFDAAVVEDALDQACAERQQILEKIDRAVIMPSTSTETPEEVVANTLAARDTAAASASAAATSESNALASKQAAATSEASALASKTAAAGSATAAASSASAASASAAAAATSEANASDSETAASSSASAAASSAIASAGSASAASTSQSNAASSATSAASSASSAATSESNAAVSETAAATSESNAATSESNAAASAVTAQAWAESESAPDPNDAESKSAKTWALVASDAVPIASTTYAGKVKASASFNVNQTTGEATVPTATESLAGIVERATNAEASAGTDVTRYITPYHLKTYASNPSSATTTTEGLMRFATDEEAESGAEVNAAVKPNQVHSKIFSNIQNGTLLGVPDYTACVARTASTNNATIESSGWLQLSTTAAAGTFSLLINGTVALSVRGHSGGDYSASVGLSALAPIKRGDTFRVNSAAGSVSIFFFPFVEA